MEEKSELVFQLQGPDFPYNMTKREYFSAMAMQALCVPCIPGSHNLNLPPEVNHKAQMAVNLADALIKELNKPEPQNAK